MPNHIHLIRQIKDKHQKASVQQSFLKYTAQQIKLTMIGYGNKEVENYRVKASNRQYQFWERNPLSIDLWSRAVFLQKLNYMHNNPTQAHWKLCQYPEEYKYSSAKFYEKGIESLAFCHTIRGSGRSSFNKANGCINFNRDVEDIEKEVADLKAKGVKVKPIDDTQWGRFAFLF